MAIVLNDSIQTKMKRRSDLCREFRYQQDHAGFYRDPLGLWIGKEVSPKGAWIKSWTSRQEPSAISQCVIWHRYSIRSEGSWERNFSHNQRKPSDVTVDFCDFCADY